MIVLSLEPSSKNASLLNGVFLLLFYRPIGSRGYRSIPIPELVVKEINAHKRKHLKEQMLKGYRTEFIFTTDSGGFVDNRNSRTACERYYKRIGVPAHGFHTYRHTFGTNLYKQGVPLKTASDLMGHKDINITARYYVGIGEEEKRKAIEILVKAM